MLELSSQMNKTDRVNVIELVMSMTYHKNDIHKFLYHITMQRHEYLIAAYSVLGP